MHRRRRMARTYGFQTRRQVELHWPICAISQTQGLGISATLGNLIGPTNTATTYGTERHLYSGEYPVHSSTISNPQTMETFPWRGHLGLHLLPEVLKQIHKNRSTLVFTNTRAQCEIWYQNIGSCSQLAGEIVMHHGSMEKKVRLWVENQLREDKLKLVVCTSSLDLG